MFQLAAGRGPWVLRLRLPTTFSRLSMWVACHLPLVLVAFPRRRSSGRRLGGATGFSLCLPGRRSVAVVAAHLLLGRVVFLRLGSGWGLWFDVATASCPVTVVWLLSLSVSGRPLSDSWRLTAAPTRDRLVYLVRGGGAAFRRGKYSDKDPRTFPRCTFATQETLP